MSFHVGQKVIALKTWKNGPRLFGICAPVAGTIYTIRAFCHNADTPSLLLEEIVNTREVCFARTFKQGEPSFAAKFFRPIQSTSISEILAQRAPKDSHKWDNRKRIRTKERVS